MEWLIILLVIGLLIIALAALIPKTAKPPKTLAQARQEINNAVLDLSRNADRLNRPEAAALMGELATRVNSALDGVERLR